MRLYFNVSVHPTNPFMIVMFASKHFLISILDIKFIYITSALGHTLINEKLVTYSQGHVSILLFHVVSSTVCTFDPSFETKKSFWTVLA